MVRLFRQNLKKDQKIISKMFTTPTPISLRHNQIAKAIIFAVCLEIGGTEVSKYYQPLVLDA